MSIKENYDGVLEVRDGAGHVEQVINSDLAIDSEVDPRKCFLVGQLHIEHYCDMIISSYFCKDSFRKKSLDEFLKSRFMAFNDKIEFLKVLKNEEGENIVDKKIINALLVFAEIRNAFQHNLWRGKAIESLNHGTRKMVFSDKEKRLSSYDDIMELMKDFKIFFKEIYPKLIAIWIKLSMSEKERQKFLEKFKHGKVAESNS